MHATLIGARPARIRRIPWHVLHSEQDASDQVWSGLPEGSVTRSDVEQFLREEGLTSAEASPDILYAYADGPREPGSPVQSEWYIEFRFEDQQLVGISVEKRLIGP